MLFNATDGTRFDVIPKRDRVGRFFEVRNAANTFLGTIRFRAPSSVQIAMSVPTADRYFGEIVRHLEDTGLASSD